MTDSALADAPILPAPPGTRRNGIRRVLLAVLAVMVIAAVIRAVWWATHPTLFPDAGSNESAIGNVDTAIWAGLTYPNRDQSPVAIHLESVRVGVASDTSAATISAYVCAGPSQAVGETALGIGDTADARRYCLHPVLAHNLRMTLGRGYRQYIVLKIVPTRPGTLTMDKFEITYGYGLQDGTQSIGMNLTIRTRD